MNDLYYLIFLEGMLFLFYLLYKMWTLNRVTEDKFLGIHYLIEKRFIELQEEIVRLKAQNKKERQGNNELLDIIYGYVHDLKNPIAAIKLTEPTAIVKEELYRLEAIIEKLLYSAKISDINNDLFIQSYSIKEVTNVLVKKFKNIFISKEITLVYEIEDFDIYTDKKWLIFAISQILSNALKYTDSHGQVKIYSEYTKGEKTLVIEDNGCGIPEAYQHRIFDKGFSMDHKSRRYKGTGIGLYICQKIFKYLNVECSYESKVDQGTKFILKFIDQSDFFC